MTAQTNIDHGSKNDLLRQKMPLYDFNDPLIPAEELAHLLVDKMNQHNAVGLAANQIGIETSVFCITSDPNYVCFNPKITYASEELVNLEEGCVSYPNVLIKIKRPKSIRVRFQDINGDTVIKKFTGMTARIFQHELDHLNGVEFYKKANRIQRDRFHRQNKKALRLIKKIG